MALLTLGRKFRSEKRKSATEFVAGAGARDDPPIGAEIHNPGIRWDLMMVIFLRFMAAVWLIKGIGFWAIVMGLGDLPLAEESQLRKALIVGFALVDCVAAVGIWLLSPWGKSLWVFLLVAEIALGLAGIGNLIGTAASSGAALALFFFFVLAFAVRSRHLGKF